MTKKGGQRDVATLKYDLHSHLLPEVDDGVKNLEEALQAIACLEKLGYTGAVITPHIYPEVFDNTEEDLRIRFEKLRHAARERFPEFSLTLGAEYYLDDRFVAKLFDDDARLLTIGPEAGWILVEFARMSLPSRLPDLFLGCRRRGLRPIIAHVERYGYVKKDEKFSLIKEWIDRGALLQMDLGSIVGQYGSEAAKRSNAILKQRLYHFIGTDWHRPGQYERFLLPAWERLTKIRFDATWHEQLMQSPHPS